MTPGQEAAEPAAGNGAGTWLGPGAQGEAAADMRRVLLASRRLILFFADPSPEEVEMRDGIVRHLKAISTVIGRRYGVTSRR